MNAKLRYKVMVHTKGRCVETTSESLRGLLVLQLCFSPFADLLCVLVSLFAIARSVINTWKR